MLKREIEASFDIEQMFRRNLELAYLPQAAAERGLYSTFMVGQHALHFIFGYDKELIEQGDFIEVHGELYEESEFLKNHRLTSMIARNVIGKRFNGVGISLKGNGTISIYHAVSTMNAIERLNQVCRLIGRDFPDYFEYSDDFETAVDQCYAALKKNPNGFTRAGILNKLRAEFESHRLTTTCLLPGDKNYTLADYRASAYCCDNNVKDIAKWAARPDKWIDHLFHKTKDFADNSNLASLMVENYYLRQLLALFDRYHIPYLLPDENRISDRLAFEGDTLNQTLRATRNYKFVVIPSYYILWARDLVNYAMIDAWFKPEDQNRARELLKSGFFYGYTVPINAYLFMKLWDAGVEFSAIPFTHFAPIDIETEFYVFSPLEQKSLIDAILTEFSIDYIFDHTQPVSDPYAAFEKRIPKWEGGHEVTCAQKQGQDYIAASELKSIEDIVSWFDQRTYYAPTDISSDAVLRGYGVLTDPARSNNFGDPDRKKRRKEFEKILEEIEQSRKRD